MQRVHIFCAVLLLLTGLFSSVFAYKNLAGIRDVQIRSDRIVTVWLGFEATSDSARLYDVNNYTISSPDDSRYSDGIHPIAISRFSKGSRSANGPFDWRALVDQFLHLQVALPFQKGKKYIVTLTPGLIPHNYPHTIQYSLNDTPNPSFKLNQVGYSNNATIKLVYLSSYLGDGKPVDLSDYKTFEIKNSWTKETVLSGSIIKISDNDIHGNDKLYLLDISKLTQEGEFFIWVEGLGRSYSFLNGDKASQKIFDIISRGMYYQRCGTAIDPPYADKWPRPMSHNKVYVTRKNIVHPWDIKVNPADPQSGDYYVPQGPLEIHGGHHDAGDFDTRLTHFVVSQKLMTLYEMMPENFYDGQVWIPEHHNGVPDILDEAAWSLLHYEYLQDYFEQIRSEFGAVPPGMESYTHPPAYPCTGDGDPLPYYMRKATPYTTFCGAAIFGQAARVFKNIDSVRAQKYLSRALAAYKYAKNHKFEKWQPENPKVLPLDWEEVYDEANLLTAWCWAAAQMYSTTGEKEYWDDFEKRYDKITSLFKQPPWKAIFPVIAHVKDKSQANIIENLQTKLLQSANIELEKVILNGENGYRAACANKGDWGFACPIAHVELFWYAFYLTRDQKYKDAIANSIDFELGMNPSEMSWMTGAGFVYPMDPLNINSKYDNVQEPIPGIVIFGPGDSWTHNQNPLYPNPKEMGFYRRISDVWGYVQGCEYVVDEQQVNMYVSAGILLSDKSKK